MEDFRTAVRTYKDLDARTKQALAIKLNALVGHKHRLRAFDCPRDYTRFVFDLLTNESQWLKNCRLEQAQASLSDILPVAGRLSYELFEENLMPEEGELSIALTCHTPPANVPRVDCWGNPVSRDGYFAGLWTDVVVPAMKRDFGRKYQNEKCEDGFESFRDGAVTCELLARPARDRSKTGRTVGRPQVCDPIQDERIYTQWNSYRDSQGNAARIEEFARAKGIEPEAVRKALDRHRKGQKGAE